MLIVPETLKVILCTEHHLRGKFVVSFSLGTSVFSFFTDPALLIIVRSGIQEEEPQYGCATGNLFMIIVNIYKSRPSYPGRWCFSSSPGCLEQVEFSRVASKVIQHV